MLHGAVSTCLVRACPGASMSELLTRLTSLSTEGFLA
jgi:hypothetical protein